jgi:phage tail protein X
MIEMSPPDRIADLLIDREAYRVCRLMSQWEFVSFCRDRNINVSDERLRKLERLKLFYPVLRIYRIDIVHKVEFLDEGRRYRDLGELEEGESWSGDTRPEFAGFDFSRRVIQSWREHGNAWDPRADESPHTETIDTDSRRHEAYYSQFQISQLDLLIRSLTVTVEIEWALEDDGTIDTSWGDQLKPNLSSLAASVSPRVVSDSELSLVVACQVISDRYYPKTQSDERHITVSDGGLYFRNWDWYEYARSWDGSAVAKLLQIEKEALRKLYERVARAYRFSDPLEKWQELVRFVKVDQRKKLKGDALKALAFGEMAMMLRLFYRDAFGEMLAVPAELDGAIIHQIPDITAEDDPSRALELVTNSFGINPKPQAVLFLEGATEMAVVPLIFDEIYAAKLNVFGIELVGLGGVSNATGGRENSYSALWRLIDYLHHHQTIAFVLLDNEGLAPTNVGIGLPRAHSIHFPDRRATRRNYVKLWKLSFEMENFNDAELAKALGVYAQGKASFSVAEVRLCRESARTARKNKKIRTLDVLYAEKTGRNLNKPQFGQTLVKLMFDPATKRKPEHRPITRFLDQVARVAARNHQPITHAMWEYNQRSGHLGALLPGAVSRRKDPFGQPIEKRRKPTKNA